MQQWIVILLVKGTIIGSVYALISLGFNVIYRTTGVLNFAQGEFVMVGSVMASWIYATGALGLPAALGVGIAFAGWVGLAVDFLAIKPVRASGPLVQVIVTMGASIVIRSLVSLIWGTEPYHLPPLQSGEVRLLGVSIEYQNLWIIGMAGFCMVVLALFFRFTAQGRAMRACSDNPVAARLCGVSPDHASALAFGLSALLGGIGGVLLTPIWSMGFDRGTFLGLKGFAAAILGGLGHPVAGVLGGLILGVLEQFSAWYSSGYKETLALSAVVLILLLRPKGVLVK
jgi:branched-chain amino acid transport system permease protein